MERGKGDGEGEAAKLRREEIVRERERVLRRKGKAKES